MKRSKILKIKHNHWQTKKEIFIQQYKKHQIEQKKFIRVVNFRTGQDFWEFFNLTNVIF